ncbi:hypothetical protein LCGC14_0735910 [marine sediment metagenome]|uniref:Nudix hydrolase domain-containing protein n=1 Tax=marine sediment metagenome TaxID=412755 RepID=A0A0F9QCD7_9ZZZZ|nr:NUDIX hydrolase [bacterium]
MSEDLQFIYKQEFWFASAFINSSIISGDQKSKEIEDLIVKKLGSLKEQDIFRKELANDILDMVKNLYLKCSWTPYIENFPYKDENTEKEYDSLGYFQFEVEHYKGNPEKKEKLSPLLIQQIPFIILDVLKGFTNKSENRGLEIDTESPIYVFVTSNGTKPNEIDWTNDNINKFKKELGYWNEIYSGAWPDYNETLYNKRIQNNLSNRLSELHFIRRNSGFIYMAKQNYEDYFESYMRKFVLDPTPKMRAVLFALRSINELLDTLFLKTQSESFIDVETIENKIKNLRLLRGLLQTKLSVIYNELNYNRRQHYTSVLKHLLGEFEIADLVSRINDKFNIIYDAMKELYQKKNEELQKRTEKGVNLLNLLFGAGILADLGSVIIIALSLTEGSIPIILLNTIIAIIISGILAVTIIFNVLGKIQAKEARIGKTVDAVIEDGKGNIVVIKRKYPPFQGFYALPGGFVEKGEKLKHALIREIKEETNLDIKIEDKIGVYEEEGRDPRGNIHSTAFRCTVIGDISNLRSGDDSKEVELVSIDKLKNMELAFDHENILKDAQIE